MTLPSFVGIGVPRGGTSWLHELLASHPQVWVPTHRKEVGFFDVNYHRGSEWYASFFPSEHQATQYAAIGEITAHYLYTPEGPERMASMGTIEKLILMLRHPTDRAYSHYWHQARIESYQESFERALEEWPMLLSRSIYSEGIARYQARFGRERMLVLISEEAHRDVRSARSQLAAFLGIDACLFAQEAGTERVNAAKVPRFPRAYAMAWHLDAWLRKENLDWVVNLGRRLGARRLLRQGKQRPAMRADTRARLNDYFAPEIERLEVLLQRDLGIWRDESRSPRPLPSDDGTRSANAAQAPQKEEPL
jgi:hypothetical protein